MMRSIKKVALWICDFVLKKNYKKIILTSGADKIQFNTKYFFEYLLKKEEFEVKYVINDVKHRKILEEKYGDHFIGNQKFGDQLEILKSGIWITDTIAPIYKSLPNPKRVFINLWHGIPLKKIGIPHEKKVDKRVISRYERHSKQYTYFMVPSEKLRGLYKKSFLLPDSKIKIMGQARNDKINARVDLGDYFKGLPDYNKAILYAPTWRGEATLFFPFEDMNYSELEEFLEDNNLVIFIKGHQFEKGLEKVKESRRLVIVKDEIEDIMEIINGFDLLITDYSSIYFDYLLTQKPIIFLPYDLKKYSNDRGLNFSYDEVTPGPKPHTLKDFKGEVEKLLSDKEYYLKERITVDDSFNEVKEGNLEKLYKLLEETLEKY